MYIVDNGEALVNNSGYDTAGPGVPSQLHRTRHLVMVVCVARSLCVQGLVVHQTHGVDQVPARPGGSAGPNRVSHAEGHGTGGPAVCRILWLSLGGAVDGP